VVRDIDDDKNARKNAILLSNDNSGIMIMLKFSIYFLLFIVSYQFVFAQNPIRCHTDEVMMKMIQRHPGLQQQLNDAANKIIQYEKQQNSTHTRNIITIPVVVHVIHDGDAVGQSENISDAQILSQINVLNTDYRRLNSDTTNTPSVFKPIAADTEIEFCLAQRDPNGNPTTGIVRHNFGQSSYTDIDMYDNIIPQTIWDRDKYLNIYTARLGGSTSDLLGYAAVPGYPANNDAVVIGFRYFGTTGTVQAPYNKGRTVTHEVGHWLGLIHIWGLNGGCFDDDNISDTPTSDQPYYGCPTYPKTSCGSEDMFMNYMDYTNDACMNIFTQGQKTRMRSVLNTVRFSIQLSDGCTPVPVNQLDIMLVNVLYPYFYACENPLTPVIEVRNNGSQRITSFYVNYQVNNGILQQFLWTGSLAFTQSTVVTLPPITFNTGSNDLLITLSLPNNSTDQNSNNNEQQISFQISQNLNNSVYIPYFEGFEASNIPGGWSLQNPNFDRTWEITNKASGFGNSSQCIFFDNYSGISSNNPKGKKDGLVTFPFNLSGNEVAQLKFNVAYARRNNNTSDSLIIYASVDCGMNWKKIYSKGGNLLATAPTTASAFIPADSNWRTEIVSLSPYAHYPSVMLKFENKSDWGNNLYIDDINLEFLPSFVAEHTTSPDIRIYPNPNNGRFIMSIINNLSALVYVEVVDITGKLILKQTFETTGNIQQQFDLPEQKSGLYIIKISDGKHTTHKRIFIH
jgi:hypothetical protein